MKRRFFLKTAGAAAHSQPNFQGYWGVVRTENGLLMLLPRPKIVVA